MSSRLLRLAINVAPIVIGLVITAWGLTEYFEATVVITPKTPAPYGILTFSSMNFETFGLSMWMGGITVKNNTIRCIFRWSVTSISGKETSLNEQIFGFQIPYHVELQEKYIKAKGWSELENESVTIEIVDKKVHMEGGNSIIYLKFTPLTGMKAYQFDVGFLWTNAIIKQTFSTYSLSVPISTTENNTFSEYFSNLNYSVHPLKFSKNAGLGLLFELPAGFEVRGAIPPITGESIFAHTTPFGFSPSQTLVWNLRIDGFPRVGEFPMSEVIRVTFESREELARRDRLLFDSGLWIGLGISNLISRFYEALRYISEMKRRVQK